MTPGPEDFTLAKRNPWGLTPHQCYALRMVCRFGSAKIAAYKLGETYQSIWEHVRHAKQRMGHPGRDVRVYLEWWDWHKEQS